MEISWKWFLGFWHLPSLSMAARNVQKFHFRPKATAFRLWTKIQSTLNSNLYLLFFPNTGRPFVYPQYKHWFFSFFFGASTGYLPFFNLNSGFGPGIPCNCPNLRKHKILKWYSFMIQKVFRQGHEVGLKLIKVPLLGYNANK